MGALFDDGLLSRAERDAVLLPLARATPLPARMYTTAAVFEAEQRGLFRHAWLCVGREDEVALPGAWLLARGHGDGPGIIVVRGADLALRALHNVCRHRATPLVDVPCGRTDRFVCPYHGFTYELSGSLREVAGSLREVAGSLRELAGDSPDTRALLERGAGALYAARVETWQGFVFVCLDDDAPSLGEALGAPPPWLADPALSTLVRGHRAEYRVAANWKLLVQNFQESLHFPRVHPALERLTNTARARSHFGPGPWLGGIMDLEDDAETVSLSANRHGRPVIGGVRRAVFDALLFPTLLTSLQPDYLLTFRLEPEAIDRTRVVFDVLFHPAYPRDDAAVRDVTDFWARANEEDRAICEQQQRGLASGVFAPLAYLDVEDGVHAFDGLYARAGVTKRGRGRGR